MYDTYVLKVLITVSIATIITRCIVLFLPSKYSKAKLLQEFNRFFPMLILSLLIIYSVKDAQWNIKFMTSMQFAYAEIIGIAITVIVHILGRRNVFLSIVLGTSIYMLIKAFEHNVLI